MKKITCFFSFVLFILPSFITAHLYPPLWQDYEHQQYYRCLMLESSLYRLESISKKADPKIKKQLDDEIYLMKFNLGIPTPDR